jgi:hypothetical protein
MNRNSVFWGIVLVLFGVLLLLDNLGIFGNINLWSLIGPLFLIALGARLLFRQSFSSQGETTQISIPLEGAERARLKLNHGAGRLHVASGAAAGMLLEGDFSRGTTQRVERRGKEVDVRLSSDITFIPFIWGPGDAINWSLRLNREIPVALDLEIGANEARLDLSDMLVSEVHLKSGANSTDLRLPSNSGFTRVRISSGAASVDVHIPQGVAAQIRSRSGLSSINVDTRRFPQAGQDYRSPDYDTAANKVDVDIEMGVGSVTID